MSGIVWTGDGQRGPTGMGFSKPARQRMGSVGAACTGG
jgi:hypothetical protein